MSLKLKFSFGTSRGGFRVTFGAGNEGAGQKVPLGNETLQVRVLPGPRPTVVGLESDWGNAGLPIRGLYRQPTVGGLVCGIHPVEQAVWSNGPLQLWQRADAVFLWFGHGQPMPRPHWTQIRSETTGIIVWFSTQALAVDWPLPHGLPSGLLYPVAGIAFAAARLVQPPPIDVFHVSTEGFV
jgi:hypothetical protein